MGQELVVNPCATSPDSGQISHPCRQGPSTQERSCRTILSNARSCRGVVFWGAPENLPGTKDPVAACLLSMQLTVAQVKPTQAAITPCLMQTPHA